MTRKKPTNLPPGIRYRDGRAKPYEVRLWSRDEVNGEWHQVSRSYKTLNEAKEGQASLRLDPPKANARMTLRHWKDQAWDSISGSVRRSTAANYRSAWVHRVDPTLGNVSLTDITATKIAGAYAKWDGSVSTKEDALNCLMRLLDAAVDDRLIRPVTVNRKKLRPNEKAGSLRSHAITAEQAATLLATVSATNSNYLPFTTVLITMGLRFGEAVALRVSDVGASFDVVTVKRTSGHYGETTPKSHAERVVPVPATLQDVFRSAVAGKGSDDLVFTSPHGKRISLSNYRRDVKWDDDVRTAVGRSDLRIHDLRHTAAVSMVDAGVPLTAVQRALGHSSLAVTQRYVSPSDDAVVAAFKNYMGTVSCGPNVGQEQESTIGITT